MNMFPEKGAWCEWWNGLPGFPSRNLDLPIKAGRASSEHICDRRQAIVR